MSAKTYNPIQSDDKFIDIIEFFYQQTGPVTGTQVEKALNMPYGTVMSHIQSAVNRKWVRVVNGNQYEIGPRMAGMYSAYKMGLVNRIDSLQRELDTLEA
ncbi:MAG TPA: hypothetical protein VF795_11770 [Desulfuromonadaceae bacterium]